jgi:rSAM/selenodomain-associated transferase 1
MNDRRRLENRRVPRSERLIVFTRYPEPGNVKTRLIPVLGAKGAAELHHRLTALTLAWASSLTFDQSLRLEIHFDGGTVDSMSTAFGEGLAYLPQVEGDLGTKLVAATATADGPTVVIGTDCPDLSPAVVLSALDALRSVDLVLGPASDGGYYLIGLNRPIPEVFVRIPWSTDRVCNLTRQIAADAGLSVTLLDVLNDVDVPDDLEWFHRRFGARSQCGSSSDG